MSSYMCLPSPLHDLNVSQIYDYFIKNMAYYDLRYNGTLVKFFDTPVVDGKWQGFHHIATRKNHKPGIGISIRMLEDRALYIPWIIPIIENSKKCTLCIDSAKCPNILCWRAKHKGKNRIKFLV